MAAFGVVGMMAVAGFLLAATVGLIVAVAVFVAWCETTGRPVRRTATKLGRRAR